MTIPWEMIRLLHTSDWHLGRQLYGHSLLEDQAFALDRLLELIDSIQPHGLLIAGDIFDRPLAPEAAVGLLDRFLHEVASKRRLSVFLIPGNHDSCERLGFASGLLRERGVTIFAKVEDSFTPVCLRGDSGTEALIFGVPFVEPADVGRALGRVDIETPDQALSELCRELCRELIATNQSAPDAHLPRVLLCHAFVAGAQTCDSEKEIFIGGSSIVNATAFQDFAYTALGHLHRPQPAGADHIRYSGSLLAYSKSEIGYPKGIVEVRISSAAKVEHTTHHLPVRRPLRFLENELHELISQAANDSGREDYIIASYTDQGAVLDAFAKLYAVYPNLLHVSRALGFNPATLPMLEARVNRDTVSELDLFAEFFQAAAGEALSEQERIALIKVIDELGREEAMP
jgi:exonuclease SbcD